jgi:hypothetical protein
MSEDLPRAIVKRIVKAKMLEIAAARFDDERTSRDLPVHKDALMGFSESAKIFIHYLSATYVHSSYTMQPSWVSLNVVAAKNGLCYNQ